MLKIKNYKPTKDGIVMTMEYALMLSNERGKFTETYSNKEAAMKSYISNGMTILEVLIEEFKHITFNIVRPHFSNPMLRYMLEDKEKMIYENCFTLETFLERNYNNFSSKIYTFCDEIIKNINLFNACVSKSKKISYYSNLQCMLIYRMKKLALDVRNTYKKLHDIEFNVEPETVGECK